MASTDDIGSPEAFFDQMVRSQVNGVYVYDLELGRNIYISPRYTELTGFTLEEINGLAPEAFAELFHPEDRELVFAHMGEVASAIDDTRIPLDYRFRHKDGDYVWLYGHDVPCARDAEGRVTRFIGSFVDITGEKEIQEDLEHFSYLAAHDLRGPARRLKLYVQALAEELESALTDDTRGLLGTIADQSQSLLDLVDDFRALTRMHRAAPIDMSEVPLESVARHAAEEVEGAPVFEFDDLPALRCAPRLMHTLFRNLFDNALKYGGADTRIRVTGEQVDSGWVIGVRNTGSSVAEHERAAVFRPFRQTDSGRRGTGLGLAIVNRVVRRHGGRAWIESGDDWTHVKFTLGDD